MVIENISHRLSPFSGIACDGTYGDTSGEIKRELSCDEAPARSAMKVARLKNPGNPLSAWR